MNHMRPNQQKFKLALALNTYTSPTNNNHNHHGDELKPKSSPLQLQKPINVHRNLQQKNTKENKEKRILQNSNIQSKPIAEKYFQLFSLLQNQKQKYDKKQQSIIQFVKSYYSQMKNIIAKWQLNSIQMVKEEIEKLKQSIEKQKKKVVNKLTNLPNKSYSQDIKFTLLNQISISSFQIEGDCMGDFDKIVERFKPVFVHAQGNSKFQQAKQIKISRIIHINQFKQNKQANQQKYVSSSIINDKNTIKKQQNIQKLQIKNEQVCEFSCDEQLSWNSMRYNDKKQNKHEIVSQIILQQPSSCQDSLIIHDGL